MTNDAQLAVVVVNHNAGPFVVRCLESVLASAGDIALDLVVVDNASLDGSAELADRGGARLIRNDANRGFAAAANQGIRATTAPFVLLLNPDAEIVAGTLSALVKVARERPRAGAVGLLVRNPDRSIQPSARRVPRLLEGLAHAFLGPIAPRNRFTRSYTMAGWDRTTEREVAWVSGSAMLLRREAIEDTGPFDEGYFMYVEDVDLCTRLRQAGWQVIFSPEVEVVHEIGVSTRGKHGRMAFQHSRSVYRYFSKFEAGGPRALLKPFVRGALWLRAAMVAGLRKRP
ncbi:MAG TPA: glycosyltransferase family 2 protein [Actinomycetota bacterium]|nr:glycosyltransferase family 2 protein [Actinomycetota bacterium]